MSGGQVHHVIKLADFGIAKVLESTQGGNTCIGTPQYMAPGLVSSCWPTISSGICLCAELYKGVAYGCSSDMWALGIVVYEVHSPWLYTVCLHKTPDFPGFHQDARLFTLAASTQTPVCSARLSPRHLAVAARC